MKRFTAILLTALMLVSSLAMFAYADDSNTAVTLYAVNTKPVLDGVVKPGEYGDKIHSVDYDNSDEFLDDYDSDHKVRADFYGTWTEEGVYFAWVVYSDIHVATAYDNEMWQYCVIQFVTTPGHPENAEDRGGNEYGICVSSENGQPHKWQYYGDADVEDWQFNGKRDETAKTTTYEVFLPWAVVTEGNVGKVGTVFGAAYAIGDQEDFNDEACMVEWQDAILGGKAYENSAVVTLAAAKTSAPAATTTTTTATTTTTTTTTATTAPKTADAGIVCAIMTMVASAGAALTIKKRK